MAKKTLMDELVQIHTAIPDSNASSVYTELNSELPTSSVICLPEDKPEGLAEPIETQEEPKPDRIPYDLLGLSLNEIKLLEFLIEVGDEALPVKTIAKRLGIPFGTTKYGLENLITKGFLTKQRMHIGNFQGTMFAIEPAFQQRFQQYVSRIKPLAR